MKKLLKFILFVGALAGVAYALRDRLMPPPQQPNSSPPPFRTAATPSGIPSGDGEDLQRVNGIGPVRVGQLAELGITTFADLADADAVDLAANLGVSVTQTEDWIGQAATLA